MYVNTDDIKKLVHGALIETDLIPEDEDTMRVNYGIMRGYLYAIQNILTEDKN